MDIFKEKKYIRQANKLMLHNNTMKINPFSEHKKILANTNMKLRNMNNSYTQTLNKYKTLKDESDNFVGGYKTLKQKESKNSSFKETFLNLILEYKNLGYKIPDFSSKKCLFNRSLILDSKDAINNYFKTHAISQKEEKEYDYIEKLKKYIEYKLEKLKPNKLNNSNNYLSLESTKTIYQNALFDHLKKPENIGQENEELKKYNEDILEIIDFFTALEQVPTCKSKYFNTFAKWCKTPSAQKKLKFPNLKLKETNNKNTFSILKTKSLKPQSNNNKFKSICPPGFNKRNFPKTPGFGTSINFNSFKNNNNLNKNLSTKNSSLIKHNKTFKNNAIDYNKNNDLFYPKNNNNCIRLNSKTPKSNLKIQFAPNLIENTKQNAKQNNINYQDISNTNQNSSNISKRSNKKGLTITINENEEDSLSESKLSDKKSSSKNESQNASKKPSNKSNKFISSPFLEEDYRKKIPTSMINDYNQLVEQNKIINNKIAKENNLILSNNTDYLTESSIVNRSNRSKSMQKRSTRKISENIYDPINKTGNTQYSEFINNSNEQNNINNNSNKKNLKKASRKSVIFENKIKFEPININSSNNNEAENTLEKLANYDFKDGQISSLLKILDITKSKVANNKRDNVKQLILSKLIYKQQNYGDNFTIMDKIEKLDDTIEHFEQKLIKSLENIKEVK